MAIISADANEVIALIGARKARTNLTRARIRWVIAVIAAVFLVVCGRLVQLGYVDTDTTIEGQTRDIISATRPPILDRNGMEMAVDIRVPSLFAEPRRIIDVDEAVEKIRTVLPDLDATWLRKRLEGDKGFVWIKRELTPAIEEKIMRLGIPGLDFLTESKRFYPGGSEASHVLGAVNIDNQGIAGIERSMDQEDVALLQSIGLARGQALTPVNLSIDLRVQHAMHDVLTDALDRYKAVAAAGAIMDIYSGEVIAMVSLPDFDPNDPRTALVEGRMNRITSGKFEHGSTFKSIAIAGALDSGAVKINDTFDARFGVRFGRYTIDDFHGKHRILSVPEIYKFSSNIGTIKVMQTMGKDNFRAFLTRMGFDDPLVTELPERTTTSVPKQFSEIVAATASFGHGISITPMHMLAAYTALVNGGNYITPTFYRRTPEQAQALYRRVVSPQTSAEMRSLMRLNALEGSGSRMNKLSDGYRVGGKTGTAEKVVNGRYVKNGLNLNIFASAFPLDNPRYAMIVLVDEPKRENAQSGETAGWNAGEATGRIVTRIAPMLGIAPNFDSVIDDRLVPASMR
ncbi:peptidoglycan D,D-transpeptidase FtsI family protein [Paradevosia shaoguanensis]|uniref:Penicillin-binding protein 2 n=1 Tax=Paradevosia shaoguanensis TaxID=1335043 RepID=A0AA41UBS5_9HYPH|nr:penicillin-binding protein 2 [Paradevosia shaoguanensis]KFL27434.1 cell division protein [Devosia sp. 17-2-E-8]QMV01327.1 penicillin-binding protein 2 [Devosia sp. D6-9]CDP50807.1 Cell division protein FtsI [Peptidoglycan syntheta se] [Devosia sp. DBB001]MCF1743345.1 penicillin-binding protein 2 [Paradevosia shaoguanensis]MCI0127828.1 penicillin-binding protein 2 [Paradevosia shaoguanensis]